jgi:hypothetical protein
VGEGLNGNRFILKAGLEVEALLVGVATARKVFDGSSMDSSTERKPTSRKQLKCNHVDLPLCAELEKNRVDGPEKGQKVQRQKMVAHLYLQRLK